MCEATAPGQAHCALCGAAIAGRRRQIFCGEPCRKAAKRKRQVAAGILPPSRDNKRAAEYKRKWQKKRRAAQGNIQRPPTPLTPPTKSIPSSTSCAQCGRAFAPHRVSQRFCSDVCRVQSKALRKRLNFTHRKRYGGTSLRLFD